MSITVSDVYHLPCMQSARILTGDSGFTRPVCRMGILDYEYISHKMEGEFIAGDFVLSSFLFARDDPRLFEDGIRTLIDHGVSMLGIKDVYYTDVPAALVDYAKANDFSIFLFSYDLFFETIIIDVGDALRQVEDSRLLEMKIDNLIENELSPSLVQTLALEINRSFHPCCFSAYLQRTESPDDGALYRLLDRISRWHSFRACDSAFKYKNGILLIFTFTEETKVDPATIAAECRAVVNLPPDSYCMGHSALFSQLHHLNKAIQESLFAAKTAAIQRRTSLSYQQIGLYQAVFPCEQSYWLSRFRDRIILPLQEYDQKFSTELLATLIAYVDGEGSIRAAAQNLYQHENTIRYRIGRIRELLHMTDDNCQFYPQVCFAVFLYRAALFR